MVDEVGLYNLVGKLSRLEYKVAVVFAVDSFPLSLEDSVLVIVNCYIAARAG